MKDTININIVAGGRAHSITRDITELMANTPYEPKDDIRDFQHMHELATGKLRQVCDKLAYYTAKWLVEQRDSGSEKV